MDFYNVFKHNAVPKLACDNRTLQIIEANDSAIDLFGFSKNEFFKNSFFDLLVKNETVKIKNCTQQKSDKNCLSYHDKIFNLFHKLHNKNDFVGSEIGLSIVKKNVEFWGGRIWLESEGGNGATLWFTANK